MITFQRCYVTSCGNTFATMEAAQIDEIKAILSGVADPAGGTNTLSAATEIVQHADKVLDILTLNDRSKPRARAINGGRKTRKAKIEQPDLLQKAELSV